MTDKETSAHIEAEGRADVARLTAWHGLAIDLSVIVAASVLAGLGIVPAAVVIGVLSGVAGARAARAGSGRAAGGAGALLPLALAIVARSRVA